MFQQIQPFLTDRKQVVKVKSFFSNTVFKPFFGAPQGFRLGPSLLLICISDVNMIFNSAHFLLFVDDLKLFIKVICTKVIVLMQLDIDSFVARSKCNYLELKVIKCNFLKLSRNKELENTHIMYLENILILESSLAKCSTLVKFLTQSIKFLDSLKKLIWSNRLICVHYIPLVRSIAEYCAIPSI